MMIAVSCQGSRICGSFDEAPDFWIYRVDFGVVKERTPVPTRQAGAAEQALFLSRAGVDLLICDRISRAAFQALDAQGIYLVGGQRGDAETAVLAYLKGTLELRADFID